jgi:hypothetical protein
MSVANTSGLGLVAFFTPHQLVIASVVKDSACGRFGIG